MKLTGYRSFNWEPSGYRCGIPAGAIPTGSVIPNVIYRTGTTPVFGPGRVQEMSIPAQFVLDPSSTFVFVGFEQRWRELLRFLDSLNPTPGELRGVLNDGTAVKTEAVVTIPAQAGEEVNTLTVVFVCVQPFFTGQSRSSGSQVFA